MTTTRDELNAALGLVEASLATEQEKRRLPGFSACVVLDQETTWAGGFGKANLETGAPATAESVYRIASITKPFTAIMLMQGRDAGLVSLDDPVEKLVPRFRLRHRSGVEYKPTYRQLASHTGGLPREAPFDYWTTMQGPTIEQVLDSLPQMELTFRPGTENKYSNLGYTLIGHAMELAFGQRYGDYVMEHIVRPLGMRHTDFQPQGETADLLAVGYAKSGTGYVPAPHLNDGDVAPGTRLYASVADIAELIKLQFRDAPTSGGTNVLSGVSVREMHAPVLMSADWSSGIS
ncbi:MAG: beta-lactamase family protein, partial [Anaerolineae bacterium]|nr:beta-lactamase family protein [Anaerolineae bacterium]